MKKHILTTSLLLAASSFFLPVMAKAVQSEDPTNAGIINRGLMQQAIKRAGDQITKSIFGTNKNEPKLSLPSPSTSRNSFEWKEFPAANHGSYMQDRVLEFLAEKFGIHVSQENCGITFGNNNNWIYRVKAGGHGKKTPAAIALAARTPSMGAPYSEYLGPFSSCSPPSP